MRGEFGLNTCNKPSSFTENENNCNYVRCGLVQRLNAVNYRSATGLSEKTATKPKIRTENIRQPQSHNAKRMHRHSSTQWFWALKLCADSCFPECWNIQVNFLMSTAYCCFANLLMSFQLHKNSKNFLQYLRQYTRKNWHNNIPFLEHGDNKLLLKYAVHVFNYDIMD